MSLEQAACLGQVLAAVAVLASVVFVGLQIRQNMRFQKIATVDALSAAFAGINTSTMESPALGEALSRVSRDWGAASPEQRIIAHYFLFSYFKLTENAWYQQQVGVLEPAQWDDWERMVRMYYHSDGVQSAWWPRRRTSFSQSFQSFLTGTVPPEKFGRLSDLSDNAPIS